MTTNRNSPRDKQELDQLDRLLSILAAISISVKILFFVCIALFMGVLIFY